MSAKTTVCLWFDGTALEAVQLYTSLLPDSSIDHVQRAPAGYPSGKAGDVFVVSFTLAGRGYIALNGGPMYKFTEAFSIQVNCDTQEEIDRLWSALSAQPEAEACGWCKDHFGLSWQIIPRKLPEWMGGPHGGKVQQAYMQMKKFDIAALEAVARGEG